MKIILIRSEIKILLQLCINIEMFSVVLLLVFCSSSEANTSTICKHIGNCRLYVMLGNMTDCLPKFVSS